MSQVHLLDHPLVQHKLTLMRKKEASTNSFRRLLGELASLMAYEVTRDMALSDIEIETPMEKMTGKVIDGKKLVFVSILRAGTGILDGMLNVVPGARVGHIGLYRDPKTLMAVEYYFKMPQDMHERDVVIVDPMLATGNSAIAAVERLKELRPEVDQVRLPAHLPRRHQGAAEGAPGRADLHRRHRPQLNEHGYILPGLGDAPATGSSAPRATRSVWSAVSRFRKSTA
jgi:uracil phosphoribosyltransferase